MYIYIYTHISKPYGYINSIYTTSPGSFLGSGIRSQAIIQQESGILEARVVCSEFSAEAAGDGTLWCWELNILVFGC